jgi:hypothetical protein
MYSGMTIFSRYSGRIVGTHQKIDRVAREHLATLLQGQHGFPNSKEIIHFEGLNGPDGIKRKSPAQDEPWHFINPYDEHDTDILGILVNHYEQLIVALKAEDTSRSAFEAAWLAHALVDGLTPAHHYPYEEKIAELRGGEGRETRTTVKKKLVMHGDTRRETLKNNWKMWGPRGLYTTHMSFEMGIASLIAPMSFKNVLPTAAEIADMRSRRIDKWFQGLALEVASLDFFDTFAKTGWTSRLARQVRRHLAPLIVRTVIIAWYSAAVDAGIVKEKT